jgi:putative heme-binding domain-containing protein
LRKWLASPQLPEPRAKVLTEILLAGVGQPALEQLVSEGLMSPTTPSATRKLLVGVIGRSRNPLPRSWALALSQALTRSDLGLQREALAAIQTRKWRNFDALLLALSKQTKLPADLRLASLECLASKTDWKSVPLNSEAFALLSAYLAESTEPLLRLSAVRTLAASSMTDEQLAVTAGKIHSLNTMTLRMLLPVFTGNGDAKVGTSLAKALARAPAAEALTMVEIDRLLKVYPASVHQQLAPLREKLANRQKNQAAYLARLTAELNQLQGDADAGKEIFLSPKHSCYACHRAVGRGGHIGPDLSRIGAIRTRAELLESIVFPNLSIAPQYTLHQVASRDGRLWTGLIVRESAEAIFLRTTDLAEVRIERTDIEELKPSSVSLMPGGLERSMTRQELRDLLEFLCQQRGPKQEATSKAAKRKVKYIDIHTHVGRYYLGKELTVEGLIKLMDQNGIERACVLPLISPEACLFPQTTEDALAAYKKYPDRIIPFCVIDPRSNSGNPNRFGRIDLDGMVALLKRYKNQGCRGFGEHQVGLPFDHPLMMTVYAACEKAGLPILFHLDDIRGIDTPGLPRLENVLKTYPKLVLIGHAAGFWASISGNAQMADFGRYPRIPTPVKPGGALDRLLKQYPNLYCDLSEPGGYAAIARDKKFGRDFIIRWADRCLFGTDYLMADQKVPHFDLLDSLDLPEDVQYKVYRGNAMRLLRLKDLK